MNMDDVRTVLEAQIQKWISATDFDMFAIYDDFLEENDVVDLIEDCDKNAELIENAKELRSEALADTLQALDLL